MIIKSQNTYKIQQKLRSQSQRLRHRWVLYPNNQKSNSPITLYTYDIIAPEILSLTVNMAATIQQILIIHKLLMIIILNIF